MSTLLLMAAEPLAPDREIEPGSALINGDNGPLIITRQVLNQLMNEAARELSIGLDEMAEILTHLDEQNVIQIVAVEDAVQAAIDSALVTHEPPFPHDWPTGHVRVELTGDEDFECVKIWIHGHTHYLHATTARELANMLGKCLDQYNEIAERHGAPTV